jgi:DNA-binding XRE family transcriptional regulator
MGESVEPRNDPRRVRLRELRQHLGLTRSAAARLAEVSRRTWQEAEEGPPPEPAATDDRARAVAELLALFGEINGDG